MQNLKINLFSVDQDTGNTKDLPAIDILEALKLLVSDQSLVCREVGKPPSGKIELREGGYYFCSNWNEGDLIIDAVKII